MFISAWCVSHIEFKPWPSKLSVFALFFGQRLRPFQNIFWFLLFVRLRQLWGDTNFVPSLLNKIEMFFYFILREKKLSTANLYYRMTKRSGLSEIKKKCVSRNKGSTETWTRIARFRVWSANHCAKKFARLSPRGGKKKEWRGG